MTFLYPHILFALALPALLGALIVLQQRRAGHGWRQLVSPAHPELVQRRPRRQVILPPVLALLALCGIILAMARPINGYVQSEGSATGRNLLIALDISRSMETQDVSPSRLDEARAAAYELIDALPGDKIGLIVFSGEADVVVPLTYDHTALRDALEQVNRSWAGIGGTNFGLLLRTAMQNFARSAPEGANALVILSDGEDTVDSSLQIADEAKKNNLLVITVGIGTAAGGPIPDAKGENGLWQDASGRHVISKLDMEALRRFSTATGGSFFAMSSGADISAFAREAAEKLDRHEENFATGRVPHDLFAWFALPSLLALLGAILLGTEWRAARLTVLVLALLCVQQAPALTAPQAYEQGITALREGKAHEARELLSTALLAEDPALQAASHLALGNIQTHATFDKLRSLYSPGDDAPAAQPSIEALQGIVDELNKNLTPYRDALSASPALTAAQENADKVQELIKKLEDEIERLKQQEQQNQDNQQNQENQQDKNDQQQQQQGDQDQQDKNDPQQQQGDQNQQDKNDPQQQQSDQNQQDKNDSQQQQGDQNQQDKNDPQQQQGDQNQQDKNDSQQQQGDQNQQDKNDPQQQQGDQDRQDKNDPQQQQGDQDRQDKNDPQQQQQGAPNPQEGGDRREQAGAAAQAQELTDEEKANRRAASILHMHLDEEKGSPIPHDTRAVRPPAKDY